MLNGGDDVGIGSAAADVAAHQLLDVGVGGTAWFLQQRHAGHDLSRGAIAALVAVMLHERGLHRVQIAGLAEAFDRRDLVLFMHRGKRQAGVHAAAVDVDRARAALAMIAALLGAGQIRALAQGIEQRRARVHRRPEAACR